jgi:hypothetical protein
LAKARAKLAEVHSAGYVDHLVGMTGVEAVVLGPAEDLA